jgi:hypothetical protein
MVEALVTDTIVATGQDALAILARRYPQLYVAPAVGAEVDHKLAATRGMAPAGATLGHFASSTDDELRLVQTPASPIEVIFLKNRADFETFLQIMGHKSQPVAIAPSIGAITYLGLADWGKVAEAQSAYLAAGGDDWKSEFVRLAHQPGGFRSDLVVISEGGYSNIPAAQTPYDEREWLRVSREIRLHHECAHVVCRRVMPGDVLAVWDEVTADVVGLLCATGRYDAMLAARFLGVASDGFHGGRLSEYLSDDQLEHVDVLAAEVFEALEHIEKSVQEMIPSDPFEYLLELKRTPLLSF